MFGLSCASTVLPVKVQWKESKFQEAERTSVDAVQPSGKIHPLGFEPWMMAG
jgi:hypothetical protein